MYVRFRIISYIVMMIVVSNFFAPVFSSNNITLIPSLQVPITILLDNNSLEVRSNTPISVAVGASICLSNYTNECIDTRLFEESKIFVSTQIEDNAFFLIASQNNMSIRKIYVSEVDLASGNALIILMKLYGFSDIWNTTIESVTLITDNNRINITPTAFMKIENDTIYISLNYDRGQLPFITFKNGDIVRVRLYINGNLVEALLFLRKPTTNSWLFTRSYARINVSNQSTVNTTTLLALPLHSTSGAFGHQQKYFYDRFLFLLNPLFIATTLILVLSLIILYKSERHSR